MEFKISPLGPAKLILENIVYVCGQVKFRIRLLHPTQVALENRRLLLLPVITLPF